MKTNTTTKNENIGETESRKRMRKWGEKTEIKNEARKSASVPKRETTKKQLPPQIPKPQYTYLYFDIYIYNPKGLLLSSPDEVIAGKYQVLHVRLRHRVVAHGTRLRVVVRRVRVEVVEVLRPVFSNTQVSDRGLHLGTSQATLASHPTLS